MTWLSWLLHAFIRQCRCQVSLRSARFGAFCPVLWAKWGRLGQECGMAKYNYVRLTLPSDLASNALHAYRQSRPGNGFISISLVHSACHSVNRMIHYDRPVPGIHHRLLDVALALTVHIQSAGSHFYRQKTKRHKELKSAWSTTTLYASPYTVCPRLVHASCHCETPYA